MEKVLIRDVFRVYVCTLQGLCEDKTSFSVFIFIPVVAIKMLATLQLGS